MDVIVTPDGLVRLVLEQFFGRASIVVFVWVLATAAIAWIGLARNALRLRDIAASFSSGPKSGPKARAIFQLAVIWVVLYGIASFVTQLWAGSQFSPGQGGGLAELLTWSALFGLLTVVGLIILLPPDYAFTGIFVTPFIGYLIGFVYAAVSFTQKGGPVPGDWWVAPAASCCLVLVSASYSRVRYSARRARERSSR